MDQRVDVIAAWPLGNGEMAARIRALDWTKTSLGSIRNWPDRIKVPVETMLASPLVSSVVCGPDRILIYNDAAAKIYGAKHPAALGRPLPEMFPQGWATVRPFYERAFAGETVHAPAQPLDTRGEGRPTEVFDAYLTPILGADGTVLCVQMIGFEIGGRLATEAALRESETRLTSVLDGIGEAYYALDREWRFLFASQSALRMWGKQPEDVIGRSFLAIFPNAKNSAPYEAHRRVMQTGVPERFETISPVLGRWIEVDLSRSDSGGLSVAFRDVDARKRSEEALTEELRNTKILQDLSARLVTAENIQAIYEDILSAAIEITRAKAGTVQMMDTEAQELVILATRGFSRQTMEYFHRVDARSSTSCGAALRTGARVFFDFDPTSTHCSTRLHVEDGVLSAQSSPLVSRSGKPIGMVSTHWGELGHRLSERELRFLDLVARQAADLLERRQTQERLRESEERYRLLFQASPAPFVILKPDAPRFTIIEVNDAYLVATLRTREEVIGRGVFEAFPDNPYDEAVEGVSTLRASFERMLVSRQRETLPRLKYDIARPDGTFEERWWSPVNSPVIGENGDLLAIIHNANDVTEEHHAAAALRASEERFRALATTGGASIYRMSPDWRVMYQLDSQTLATTAKPIENWADKYILSDDRARVDVTVQQAISTKSQFELEHRVLLADGGTGWVLSRAVPMLDEHGKIIEWFGAGTDVTARIRAVEALRESEEKYRGLFESIDEGFCIIEMIFDGDRAVDYLFIEVNPAFERQTGIVNASGRRMREIAPDHEEHWFRNYGEVALTGQAQRFEASAQQLGDRYFELHAFPVGEPAQRRVAIVFNDITQRQRNAEALRQSELRYRNAARVGRFGSWETDFTTNTRRWSKEGMDLFGLALPNGIGQVGGEEDEWRASLHADEADLPSRIGEVTKTENLFNIEYRIVRPDGRILWLAGHAEVAERDSGGRPARLINVAADITERRRVEAALRESEARLREFGEASQDVLWVRDAQTLNWTYLTPAFEQIYGISRKEALEGDNFRNWTDLIVPEDRDRAVASIQEVREGKRATFEFRIRRPVDGEIRWLRNTDFPILDDRGRVTRIGGVGTDFTAEKEISDRMEVMVAELQHRTRNLIAVIRSIAVQTMASTGPTEAFRDEFNHRLEALSRVQGLLSRSAEDPITIEGLIRLELEALGAGNMPQRVLLTGPAVRLRRSVVQTLALAVHELATNARKYGALAGDLGRLDVTWRTYAGEKTERLTLDWLESAGPIFADHGQRHGYGRELIERALPYSLNAKTKFELNAAGVHCTIDLPLTNGETRAPI